MYLIKLKQVVVFCLQVVSLLLNYGADITLCNNKGQSVLDFASDSMRPLLLGMYLLNQFKTLGKSAAWLSRTSRFFCWARTCLVGNLAGRVLLYGPQTAELF